ncbi:MAG: hypothetical protein JXB35_05715, partial [Anaerolineae bacterium]|nr:hypothetical protein [Anaerolineae bacterium]
DQIRSDLAGRLAADSVVILSHACFSAGNSACDPAGTPSLDEAERRVAMYAAPFVDVGMDAYFANNYFDSAAAYVDRLLAAPAGRQTAGDIFKSVYPFQQSQFYDLTYPTPAYDLWLSGSTGNWSDAFVGIPAYIFAGDTAASPALGGLPDTLSFSYDRLSGVLTPPNATLSPVNAGNDTVLQWQVSPVGNWFGVSPTQGTTGQTLTITPQGFDAGQDGTYTGSVTITVTDPPGVTGSPHTVTLSLDVTSEPTYGLFLPLVVTP